MSTIRANNILDSAGGNTATINGITPALASQAEAEAGTDNTKLMTPLRVAQAIAVEAIGIGQTWQNVSGSRSAGTSYQNTTGRPIMVSITSINDGTYQVSSNNSTWIDVGSTQNTIRSGCQFIVPQAWYYRLSGTTVLTWAELR